jgi:flagellar protein FliO/FliZ
MPAPQATEALAAPGAGTSAATTPLTTGAAVPELGASVLQMMFGLAVVIALLFASLWLIRRLSAPRGGTAIKVLAAAAVGPRERVVLIELGEQVLVLGVAPGSVTRLHDMKRSELPVPVNAGGTNAPGGKAFAAWLKQATERRNAG